MLNREPNQIIDYDELNKDISFEYYYPSNKEFQLINSIKAGNYSNVKDIIEELYYRNFKDKILSPFIAKVFMFSLIDSILKSIKETQCADSGKYLRKILSLGLLFNLLM